jgi:hypothetical protein
MKPLILFAPLISALFNSPPAIQQASQHLTEEVPAKEPWFQWRSDADSVEVLG